MEVFIIPSLSNDISPCNPPPQDIILGEATQLLARPPHGDEVAVGEHGEDLQQRVISASPLPQIGNSYHILMFNSLELRVQQGILAWPSLEIYQNNKVQPKILFRHYQ